MDFGIEPECRLKTPLAQGACAALQATVAAWARSKSMAATTATPQEPTATRWASSARLARSAARGRGWRRHRIGVRPETGELVNTRCRSGLLTASYVYPITPGLCVSHWLARHWLGPLEARRRRHRRAKLGAAPGFTVQCRNDFCLQLPGKADESGTHKIRTPRSSDRWRPARPRSELGGGLSA